MAEEPKKTKKQLETDKVLNDLEFIVDDLLNDLRSEIEENGLKKKHKTAIAELKYSINRIKNKLWPNTGPRSW